MAGSALVLAVLSLFVGTLVGEAYALHECDHHHRRTPAPSGHHGTSALDSSPLHGGAEGPCCCPDGFHSGSAAILPVSRPEVRVLPPASLRIVPADRAAELGFRAPPTEYLPPPNAPPLL